MITPRRTLDNLWDRWDGLPPQSRMIASSVSKYVGITAFLAFAVLLALNGTNFL